MSIFAELINKFIYNVENVISFNDVFCTFIVLVAVVSFRVLHKEVGRNIKDIQNFIAKSEDIRGELPDRLKIVKEEDFFNGNEFLLNKWENYTSYVRNNIIQGRIPEIHGHFSKFNIIDNPGKRKIAELIPGTLTALGILGTFLGLQGGVSKIDVETTERLKDSIILLTSGMSLAFITSIVGISASIFWSYTDRKRYKYYIKVLDQFYNTFNTKYPVFNSSTFYNEIIQLQREATNSIKHLATDFSLEFSKVLSDSINQSILPNIDEILNRIVQRDINPSIKSMNDMIDNFTTHASDRQTVALNAMVDDFISKLNDTVEFQFDGLEKAIVDFTQWHIETKSSLEELIEQIKESALNQKEINISAGEVISNFTYLFDRFNLINMQVAEGIEKMEGALFELNGLSAYNSETLEGLNNIYEKINKSYEYTENSLNRLINSVENSMNSLNFIIEELQNSSKVFVHNLDEGLNATFSIFDNSLSEISRRISGTILEVQQTIDDLPIAISMLVDELKKNINKLSETIDEINGIYKDISIILNENKREVIS